MNALFRRWRRDERGAVAVLVAAGIFGFVGFGALVADVGYYLYARSVVQATANAAALAGAQEIGNGGNPVSTATTYSAVAGDKNAVAGLSISMATGYPQLSCATNWATNAGVACSSNYTTSSCATAPCTPAVNLITVQETANVPTFFGRIFGISSIAAAATATASAAGSALTPYNVALIVDTTASMGGSPQGQAAQNACSGYSTAIACAAAGAQTMLGEFWPCASGSSSCGGQTPVDEIALFVFPPVTNASQATADIGCTSPQIANYYSGVANTTNAATMTSTLSLATTMTAKTEYNTGAQWAVATDAGQPTTARTSSGNTLTFTSGNIPTTAKGLAVKDTTTPAAIAAGTTVSNVSGGTVTLSQNVAATVNSGDLITFGASIPAGTGSWPWWDTGIYVSSVTLPSTAILSATPTGAGVLKSDTILVGPLYEIVPFANDYRTSDTSGLNSSSNIVKITNHGCLGTPGGLGTYYADAISAAQSALAAEQAARKAAGNPAGQNVIVFLSDGNATSSATQMGPLKTTTGECQAAVTAAQNAAKNGTTVYTIYYDDNGSSSTCTYDSGNYTGSAPNGACYTLQQMAVAPGKSAGTYVNDQSKLFYSIDGTSAPCPASASYSSIASIFQHIVSTLTNARLVPVGTS